MKIEKITLCNLTAYEGEHTIDFTAEPLRSAGLFAITGDTGAGKSTLLDAICLALYGNAPRFDNIRNKGTLKQLKALGTGADNETEPISTADPRNMMRRAQKSAYCRVLFSMPDGARYEAVWMCRLKRTGSYDSVSREIRQIEPKKKTLAEGAGLRVQPVIDELIGLDYKQFSRTVMLAQGSFATFLKADKEEKAALLEKMTGTEIYGRISRRIHEISREADKKVEMLQSLIDGILTGRLAEEQLADVKNDLHQKTALAEHLQESIDTLSRRLQWLDDYEKCTEEVGRLEKANIEAKKALEEMRKEQLELARYDSVLPRQPLFRDIVLHRDNIATLKTQTDETTLRLATAKKELGKAAAALDTAREQAADAEAQLANRQPAINRGHKLTGEIEQAQAQVSRLATLQRQAQAALEERTRRLQKKQKEICELQQQVQQLQLHRQSLAVHRVMFEKIELVRDKLASFRTESEQNRQDHMQLTTLQQNQNGLVEALKKLESRQQSDEDRLATLKGELLIHRQTITGQDSRALQKSLTDNRNRAIALGHALTLWKKISTGYEDLAERRAKIARDTVNTEQLRKDIERAAHEERVHHEAYESLNEAYLLSNSENIQRLRRHLKEGTACPVCGSAHHPYHTETEQELGEVLDRLEKEHLEAEASWRKKRETLNLLKLRLAAEEGELKSDRATLQKMQEQQQALEEEWQEFAPLDPSLSDCSQGVNREARRTLISMLLDGARKAAEEAEQELNTYNYHQTNINQYTAQVETLTAQISANRTALNDMRTNLKVNQSQMDTTQQRINRSDRACEQLYRDLDETISLSEWFAEWQRNPDNFRLRLNGLCQDWTDTHNRLDELSRNETIRKEELHAAEENLAEADRRLAAARDDHDDARKALEEKQGEMRTLFGNLTPENVEEQLHGYVRKMNEAKMKLQQAHDECHQRLTELQGRFCSLEESRQAKQQEYGTLMSQLDMWMLKYNADHSPLQFSELERIFTDPRDWNALRNELDRRKGNCTLVAHRLEQARQQFTQLQASPLRTDSDKKDGRRCIEEQQAGLRRQLAETTEEAGRLKTLLFAHENSLAKAEAHRQELAAAQEDATEWQRLNLLLGSADGKKFRELAQSYTFRFLVDYANVQLRQLSPRYELRNIPGTLILQIIDRDMFDQCRYVSSLSGGETFVVSLALALGLATLSAGSLAIGSLFIDEGFGNLDHDSLDLVMQALSNLEDSQGRKVGIVSHTDQIRSQISPQIRVRKLPGGGKSEIVVS